MASTTYGTIPTEAPPLQPQIISLATNTIQSTIANLRPWPEMLRLQSIKLPTSLPQSIQRLKTNIQIFRSNYFVIMLLILLLTFLLHPVPFLLFAFTVASWLYLYFWRDQPLVVNGRVFGDGTVLLGLTVMTVVMLSVTDAMKGIVSGFCVWIGVVLVHGVLRDSCGSESNNGEDMRTPQLKNAAVSPYSLC